MLSRKAHCAYTLTRNCAHSFSQDQKAAFGDWEECTWQGGVASTTLFIWKLSSCGVWQLCSVQRNGEGTGDVKKRECSSLNSSVTFIKVFNNAHPSEVNEASQTNCSLSLWKFRQKQKTPWYRIQSIYLTEFLKGAVSSLTAVFKYAGRIHLQDRFVCDSL